MSKMTDFATWLLKELEARELTQTDLADYLGVSRQTVNYYIMKGDKKRPGDKVLYKIAKFFKISPETIYRNIGVLPENKENEITKEISYLVADLPEEDQQDVIEYIRHRLALAEKRGKSDTKKDLQQLSLDDLKRVRRYARYKRLLHRITTLHPKQMLIPVAMQIASFAMLVNKSILYAAVANMVIVGIALLPFALRKPERQMIRENK